MHNRIVIVGGNACGAKAAARARRCDPHAKITILEQGRLVSYAGCGLPYYISGVIKERNSLLARTVEYFKDVNDVDVLIGNRAEAIDRAGHTVKVLDLATHQYSILEYDSLVMATGASPVMPPIPGRELAGIHMLKEVADADDILSLVTSGSVRKAAVIGAGLIGMEMAEVLAGRGLKVTLVEALDSVLPALLDKEMALFLASRLARKGIDLKLGDGVVRFEGEAGLVRRTITRRETLETDTVIVAVGVRPNVELARKAGLDLGATGAIAVNEHLQTSDGDIYAGGDCVENTHLLTGGKVFAPMGSTANKHGRVIGANITGGDETFAGVLGTSVVKVFEYNVGRVGLGEKQAQDAGFDVVAALVPGLDRAHYYPGARDILLKLIADRRSRRILGGQAVGQGDVAKRIDVLATTLTYGGTVDELANLDIAYAPPYNAALDVLHNAANVIRNKLSGIAQGVTPAQVKAKLDNREDFILLDVRNHDEWDSWRVDAPQVRLAPLPGLREKMDELPQDKEIVTLCRRGVRAYQAQKLLEGAGFQDVRFMEGSMAAWPYEVVGEER